MTTHILGAAAGVAESRVVVANTAAALASAETHRDTIKNRIAEKQAERAEVVAARKAGVETAKDAGRLLVIAADTENLEALLGEAEAIVSTRTRDANEAKRILGQAESDLAKAIDTELLGRLIENAILLDGLMVRNIRDIADTWKRLGRSPGRESWAPTPALADTIKRLDLTRENRR